MQRRATHRVTALLVCAILAAVITACYPAAQSARADLGTRRVISNVEARDYAGSAACVACHADVAATFASSPMHRMTRMVTGASVAAPFQGESISLGDDRATLEMRAGVRFVRIDSGGAAQGVTSLLYRVTRVLGGHHREDFVGVLAKGYDDRQASADGDGDEMVLPVSYLIEKKRLRYKGYSVMVRERSRIAAGPVWNRTCPFCHNTVPLLSTLLGALAGPRAPHFQGEVVDPLLPEDRAFSYRSTDDGGLEAAISRELDRLGAAHAEPRLRTAIETTRARFTGSKLLEVGIGCEACHGGCREHVRDPSVHPSPLPRAPFLNVATSSGSRATPTAADVEDHMCARCHQVLFSRYPWTWEGGRRSSTATMGGSHINSGEGRDLLLGGCRGALRCTACHNPHAPDEAAHLASLATPKGNAVCLGCHAALTAPEALRAHAHHDPAGAGGACLACHMPKKNMALDGRLTPYHRVGSPTEPARVLNDRPVECAVCHADKSVEELVGTMERWWTKVYNRDVLRASYGDLGQGALIATLRHGKPHEKAVALSILGDRHDRGAGPLYAAELTNEYPLVREYAATALREAFGDACDVDLAADKGRVDAAMARCSEAAGFALGGHASGGGRGNDEPPED